MAGSPFRLYNADCIHQMSMMLENSVDSIVTDPPYELGFMGKSWDSTGIANSVEMWTQALRVLKPGGHLLAFSGSRTYHRMACAIEDAGFEIRDQIMWVYGSGFPKSHNISKGIDKSAGFEGEVIGTEEVDIGIQGGSMHSGRSTNVVERDIKELSPEARQWQGWGTALKPAHEPIVLARKPLQGTVAQNVLEHGTGGLNIDGSRVGMELLPAQKAGQAKIGTFERENMVTPERFGRFPANFIHDGSDEVEELLGEPARFFYCAKTSKRDRNEGLEGFEEKFAPKGNNEGRDLDNPKNHLGGLQGTQSKNHHPTVKPTDLMRYLCRLITPPNGIVLDPFMGSGSTGKAAILEGFRFIGIDQSAEYVEIAKARIEFAEKSVLENPTQEFLL